MSDLSVRIDLSDRVPVVTVVGDVDHHMWPTLAVMVANVVHAGNEKAVVDLSGVEFMDSGALKAFAASGTCELSFRDASPIGRRILERAEELRFADASSDKVTGTVPDAVPDELDGRPGTGGGFLGGYRR